MAKAPTISTPQALPIHQTVAPWKLDWSSSQPHPLTQSLAPAMKRTRPKAPPRPLAKKPLPKPQNWRLR